MRKILVSLCGILMLGIGAALLRYADLGSDPFNTMIFAVSGFFSISFTAAFAAISGSLLVLVFVVQRKLLGVASFVMLLGLGPAVEVSLVLLSGLPHSLPVRLTLLVLGLVALGIGCAFCLRANLGVAPYDGLAPILADRLPIRFSYCRMMTDGVCVLIGALLGGKLGVATVIVAFGLGPIIAFFLSHLAEPLLPDPPAAAAPAPSR